MLTPIALYAFIGLMTVHRLSHDSADQRRSSKLETSLLNQGQLSMFTADLLKLAEEKTRITAWDVYNVATELYKPGKTDFPAMIPQNGAFAELLLSDKLPQA